MDAAQRRVGAATAHLQRPPPAGGRGILAVNPTAAEYVHAQGYSVVLPEKLQTGKWNVYRSARSPLRLIGRYPDTPDIGTLHDNFTYAVETFTDCRYLGTRIRTDGTIGDYKWMTYGEASTRRTAIGSGLIYHGVREGACIGLYFINRPEWIIVDHACSAYSYVSVPLYDTLGPDAVQFIVNHAAVEAIFCVPQTLGNLLSFIAQMPCVRLIVVVGGDDANIPSMPVATGVQIITYSRLLIQGKASPQHFRPPKPEDVATICYTSGTTGTPKGVVLSHENLIANVAGSSLNIKFYPSDVYISYLPLAHIYERVNQIAALHCGVAIGFYQGDNLKLMDDLAALRPTVFASVPRLYNRIYTAIINAVKESGGLKEKLFHTAYNAKRQAILNGKSPSPVWDKLVFNKIKARLGGRVRLMSSGASPLSADVMEFLRICFGGEILEGYGMTETSCIISAMDVGDKSIGHVGSPIASCEVKLVDVPEMNYTSDDQPYPRGEICVRGPIIFRGYYKDEVQTKEVIDEDGWLHTGDIVISQGINAGDVKKLQDAGIYTCNGLMMHTKKNLTGIKGLSEAKVDKICEAADKLLRKSVVRITTGSQALDELLGGGIETLCITEAFGEFRSGKTQLAHTLCVSTQLPIHMHGGNGKVAYIDTEGTLSDLNGERIVPIAERFGMDANAVLDNIIYARAYTYEHLYNLLLGLAAKMAEEPFRLLIVDSVIALFRVDFSGRGELAERQQKLAQMLSRLTKIAEEFNVAVYITNQVIADPGGGMFITDPKKPAGGHVLAHAATIRSMLRKGKGEQRVCKIFDAPNLPEGEAVFQVTSGGIMDGKD